MKIAKLLIIIFVGGVVIVYLLYQITLGPEVMMNQAIVRAVRVNPEPPESAVLNVPYTVQAPFAKWDAYDEDACEEAALLMAYEYIIGSEYIDGVIPHQQAQDELKQMIDFQVSEFDYKIETDLYEEETKLFVESYWPGYSTRVIETSIEAIKKEIVLNNPVVIPATAEILNNPHYHYPDYHMLTIIGYSEDSFITNDPGTKHGEDWKYNQIIIIEAIENSGGVPVVLEKK
ncbi:MAG: C39 family peptidase [Candidatus Marinimicrobia bacterium]|nr:C39 family peptidase [Candidatus Neomarinimicrobiota bacterium]